MPTLDGSYRALGNNQRKDLRVFLSALKGGSALTSRAHISPANCFSTGLQSMAPSSPANTSTVVSSGQKTASARAHGS